MRYLTRALLFVACGWGAACGNAPANDLDPPDVGRVQPPAASASEPIETGYVVANGRYIPPPYILQLRGGDLILNGRVVHISAAAPAPGGSRQYVGVAAADRALEVQHWLKEGCVLFIRDQRLAWVNAHSEAHWLLRTLDTEDPADFKLDQIEADADFPIDRAFWLETIQNFEPSAALRDRLDGEISQPMTAGGPQVPPAALMYALNVGGMVLVVLAFGTLLGHQPPRACDCHTCAQCGNGATLLLRNVALVVVLSAFDLGCTVVSANSGIMAELNPMADAMIHSPVALSAFKLTATLAGAGILIHLREHRRAQVASWWVCLVCSLLVFRWVSFHSLFMA